MEEERKNKPREREKEKEKGRSLHLPSLSRSSRGEVKKLIVFIMRFASQGWFRGLSLLLVFRTAVSMVMQPNSTGWEALLDKYLEEDGEWWQAKQRGRRAITDSDMQMILDLHNKLRGQVYPQASNMEYMVRFRNTAIHPYTVASLPDTSRFRCPKNSFL